MAKKSAGKGRRPTQGLKSVFQVLCRQLFALLKIIHHLEVMQNSKQEGLPRAFRNKIADLIGFLRPARPNPILTEELSNIARIWGVSVRDRLITHYEAETKKVETAILTTMADNADHLENAKQVALNWAKSRLGKRLSASARDRFLSREWEFLRHSVYPPTSPVCPLGTAW